MSNPDLVTGSLEPSGEGQEASKVFIDESEWRADKEELAELRGYKKGMEDSELRLGQQHPEIQAPPTPPAPPPEFPLHSDEELQTAIAEGDLSKYHKLNSHNQKQELARQRWEIETTQIEPLRQVGLQNLSELSGRFATQTMEHLDVPEVKKAYEERLGMLKAQGQVINAELHQGVYDWSVGTNVLKVQEKIQQGILRAQEIEVNTPTGPTGRSAGAETLETPSPEQFFDPTALSFLARKHPGLSPTQAADKEYARHGGWEAYHKKFYGPKEEEK